MLSRRTGVLRGFFCSQTGVLHTAAQTVDLLDERFDAVVDG